AEVRPSGGRRVSEQEAPTTPPVPHADFAQLVVGHACPIRYRAEELARLGQGGAPAIDPWSHVARDLVPPPERRGAIEVAATPRQRSDAEEAAVVEPDLAHDSAGRRSLHHAAQRGLPDRA